jgi:hypothetical protein
VRDASDNKDISSDVIGRWRFMCAAPMRPSAAGLCGARSWRFGLFPDLSVVLGQPALRILAGPSASLPFRLVWSHAVYQLVCMWRLGRQS